jgi:hypothetical protein
VVLFVLVSCSGDGPGVSPDLLRASPFEVVKWSPGGGYHADPSTLSVSLSFSHAPDRASVERHFSLTGDGDRLSGVFRWDGGRLAFLPAFPLEINRDYVLSLASDAHDKDGVSMDKAFEGRFTTRPDNARPVLVSFSPETNGVVSDPYAAVYLAFSQSVPINSLRDYVSFEPSMNGSWRMEGEGLAAVFTPAEPWVYGKRYRLKIAPAFAGNTGMTLGKDFASVFIIGADLEKPILSGVWRLTKKAIDEKLVEGKFIENPGWEKDDKLRLVFSKPVDTLSVRNCLSVEGAPSLRMETAPGLYDEAVFCFENPPAYESRFSFRLKSGFKDGAGNESGDEYLIRVFTDGVRSKPPALVGMRLPMAPGSATDKKLTCYRIDSLFDDLPIINAAGPLSSDQDHYPYTVQTATWIECYFETAPGLAVDPFSLMALFRIETSNNALVFSPRLIKESSFSAADPEPGWENYQRLEIAGFLTNTVNSGVISIHIDSGLKDTGGNRNEKAFCISLLK